MERVKLGFFSLTRPSERADDLPYLQWHLLDHMPEQYRLAGLVNGQRWASTPACRGARIAEDGDWTLVEHLVCYLMGDPVQQTLEDFFVLGRELAEVGRFPLHMPTHYKAGLDLVDMYAAPRVQVSAEVVPFRPNRGVLLVVEEPTAAGDWGDYVRRSRTEVVPELLTTDGVAGAWVFAPSQTVSHPAFSPGDLWITICYLDDEPSKVAGLLEPVLRQAWSGAPTRPLLAAPFEAMMHWDWDRFAPA